MELDLKYKKILAELELNARISHSILAKKVGLSKQVVKYRIEKLENENIIQGYNTIIDLNKLEKTIYVIYLKLIRLSSAKEKEWINKLNRDKEVMAVGKNAGHWDMTIVIVCKNNQELDKIFKKITAGKTDKIKEKLITSEIESTYFNLKLFYNKNIELSTSDIQENVSVDDKDLKLISYMAENCRFSLLELADKIRLSPNGVKYRIKQLEKNKIIIGYKTKINYEMLGYLHFRVFLHLDKFNDELYTSIKNFLKEKGNVESVSRYVGYADIDFRSYSKSISELYGLISKIRDNYLQNIIEIDSIPIFSWEKIKYF